MKQQLDKGISTADLTKLFAQVMGWKFDGRNWTNPNGDRQLHVVDYADNDVMAWGALEKLAGVNYVIARNKTKDTFSVQVGTGSENHTTVDGKRLARAIVTAVLSMQGVLKPQEDIADGKG